MVPGTVLPVLYVRSNGKMYRIFSSSNLAFILKYVQEIRVMRSNKTVEA